MARVTAAVNEFINLWACGGNASLKLDTCNGGCTVSFTANLGHPGALLQPSQSPASPNFQSPSSPVSGQRYRRPAEKQRSRMRAASRQATAAAEVIGPEVPAPSVSAAPSSSSVSPPVRKAAKAENVTTAKTDMTVPAVTAESECDQVASTSCKAVPPPSKNVKCLNCDHKMAPDHQCEELPSASSSNIDASVGTKTVENEAKNTSGCQGLTSKAMLSRQLRMKKFCETCDALLPLGSRCPTCGVTVK